MTEHSRSPVPGRAAAHAVFWIWLASLLGLVVAVILTLGLPVDFEAYDYAARALADGRTPYTDPALIHEKFRQIRSLLVDGVAPPENEVLRNPYIYPPTLAAALLATGNSAIAYITLLAAALAGFAYLWLRLADVTGGLWLLLCVLSWDLAANLTGGNAEIFVMLAALSGAWAMWTGRIWLAGAAFALAVLIKPFWGLFIAGFALIQLRADPLAGRAVRHVAGTAALALALVAVEFMRWPPALRAQTVAFFADAAASTFVTMPVHEQMPMSGWNRAPLQIFVTLGLPLVAAKTAAIVLWAAVLGIALAAVPRARLGFPLAFALALVVGLFARPTTWALPFFDLVVLAAIWPWLRHGAERGAALTAALMLAASHWLALALTLAGLAPSLLSLQTDRWPVETVVVLPGALALTLLAVRRAARDDGTARHTAAGQPERRPWDDQYRKELS